MVTTEISIFKRSSQLLHNKSSFIKSSLNMVMTSLGLGIYSISTFISSTGIYNSLILFFTSYLIIIFSYLSIIDGLILYDVHDYGSLVDKMLGKKAYKLLNFCFIAYIFGVLICFFNAKIDLIDKILIKINLIDVSNNYNEDFIYRFIIFIIISLLLFFINFQKSIAMIASYLIRFKYYGIL